MIKKVLFNCVLSFFIVFVSVGCDHNVLTSQQNSTIGNGFDNDKTLLDLSINNPLPTINTLNNTSYPVSGTCDPGLGDVTISQGAPPPLPLQTLPCDALGAFSGTINMTSVGGALAYIFATQGERTAVANPAPINDQTPIVDAPVAFYVGVNLNTIEVSAECNEPGEIVSFSNPVLAPNPQSHTCTNAGPETVFLDVTDPILARGEVIVVSSVDENGNPTTNNSSFFIPMGIYTFTVYNISGSANTTFTVTGSFTVTLFDPDDDLGVGDDAPVSEVGLPPIIQSVSSGAPPSWVPGASFYFGGTRWLDFVGTYDALIPKINGAWQTEIALYSMPGASNPLIIGNTYTRRNSGSLSVELLP